MTPTRQDARLVTNFWRSYVHIGVVAYGLGGIGVLGYLFATPSGHHRTAIVVLDVLSLVASLAVFWWLGLRLVPTRWRNPFFGGWTMSTFAFVGVAAGLDGGIHSPLCFLLALPLLFAGLAYTRGAVVALTGVGVAASFAVGSASSPRDWWATFVLAVGMAVAGMLAGASATKRDELIAKLVEAADHDGLTGCLTRRAFSERLGAEIARAERYGKACSVVLADLDRLKDLNDTGGHEMGDDALQLLAAALQATARATDTVGRLGGDEFALLLPETGAGEVEQVAARVQQAVRMAGTHLGVTASLGAATWAPGDDVRAVLRRADEGMYSAKRAGGDRVVRSATG